MPKEKKVDPVKEAEEAKVKKHQAFNEELIALCDKYGVTLEPFCQITIKDK